MGTKRLAVVIPTTHSVDAVTILIANVRRQLSQAYVVVVDNGPAASNTLSEAADRLIVRSEYLGSERAFLVGLEAAGEADRYLLLDHDAEIGPGFLGILLDLSDDYPDVVLSANQCGTAAGWWFAKPKHFDSRTVALRAAQWSGLLLTPAARAILLEQKSGYFFGWDDYLAVHRLRDHDIQVLGVPAATVANNRSPGAELAPWRGYYDARNEVLFQRDTQASRLEWCKAVYRRIRALYRFARGGHTSMAIAMGKGFVHGLMGRRGYSITPTDL